MHGSGHSNNVLVVTFANELLVRYKRRNQKRRAAALSGSAKTLTVNSGGNQIALEKVESVTLNGSGNRATYSVKKNGGKAEVTDNGRGNSVSD